MKPLRRKLLILAMGAVAAAVVQVSALALDYPTRPVRVIEGFGVGGTPDLISRLIAQWLTQRLGQPFIVDNRTGASGNIAAEAVIKAAPDGYMLLTCLSANAINASLYHNLSFDFPRDVVPVAGLIRLPMVLLVNPSFPAKTFAEFLAYAKANPGKINIASPGIGTPMYVAGELIDLMAGVKMVDVPYRGPAGAFTDLLAGRVQAFIITVPAAIGFVRSGKLRALAVTGATRAEVLPDVPTIGESLPGFEATPWDGICAPKRTPAAIVDKLNAAINAGLKTPAAQASLAKFSAIANAGSPDDFKRFLAEQMQRWAGIVKLAGARID